MIQAEESVVINRPLEEVFDFVADQRNAPKWQSNVVDVTRLTDGPPGVGTKHAFSRMFMGRKMVATNEYISYEPGSRVEFRSTSGPMQIDASYAVESAAGGTKVTSRVELRPAGMARLMQPLIANSLKGEMRVAVSALKDLLEAEDAGPRSVDDGPAPGGARQGR